MLKRLLIVDDEPLICEGIARRISEIGGDWVVAGTAGNGREALDWLSRLAADICITDIKMPLMDGLELIRHIKERHPWMAAIAVSSYDDFSYAQESVKLGVADYILKPIRSEAMRDVLLRTTSKLEEERKQLASTLFLRQFHSAAAKAVFRSWTDKLSSGQLLKLPSLIVDTLELFEAWADDRCDLLPLFAGLWLDMIAAELQLKRDTSLAPALPEECMAPAVQLSRLRLLCRLTAVGFLENNGFSLPAEDRSLNKRTVVEQVKAYIESNYREHLRIDDLARLAAVSRTALAVTFKQETGLSIWGYVHRIRMLKAREYLLSGSYKMYEIASMVGYDDRKYFSELFKDHYGQNPLEYKKAMEES